MSSAGLEEGRASIQKLRMALESLFGARPSGHKLVK